MIRVTGSIVEKLLKDKKQRAEKLEAMLEAHEIREALKDHHARREPIACGMTIHTGVGCSFGCVYCYVPDMGFPLKPRPYPLNGLQLAYALLSNPYIVPGPYGTMLAYGSVTEPFLPETIERTLDYLNATRLWLGNPTQIATKSYIDENTAKAIRSRADPLISILVTIITLKHAVKIEPKAPSPQKRLETILNLSSRGLHVSLFLRPIIPGVTEDDLEELLKLAYSHGARGVVLGSLRITQGILKRLEAVGVPTEDIRRRALRVPQGRQQIPINVSDIKSKAARIASEIGLKIYPSSCSANMDAHNLACWMCRWGPCGDPHRLPEIDENGVIDAVEYLTGMKPLSLNIHSWKINILFKRRIGIGKEKKLIHWLSTIAKRHIIVKYV